MNLPWSGKAPAISLKCDCGTEASVGYRERWTCPSCGRVYNTSGIPEDDYAALLTMSRRYRRIGWALMGVIASITLFLMLFGYPFQVFIVIPGILIVWFTYVQPALRKKYRARMGELTKSWELTAESGV